MSAPYRRGGQGGSDNIRMYLDQELARIQASLADLGALSGSVGSVTGIVVGDGLGGFTGRTITGTAGRIGVTNGSGVLGNPTIDLTTVVAGATLGDSTHTIQLTFDAYGRVTAATPIAVLAGGTQFDTPGLHGALGTGSVTVSGTGHDDKGNFDAVAAATNFVLITPGIYRFGSNATYGSNVTWWFMPGAIIAPDAGVTVEFRGPILAKPEDRLFGNNGSVVGIRDVYAEWWGLNGTTDQVAINKAIFSAENSNNSIPERRRIRFLAKNYVLTAPVVFTVTLLHGWDILGAGIGDGSVDGTTFIAAAGFSPTSPGAGSFGAIHLQGADYLTSPGTIWSNFTIRDFIIQNTTAGSGCWAGLQVGTLINPGVVERPILSLHIRNTVSHILSKGFSANFYIQNTREITFDRCASMPQALSGSTSAEFGFLVTSQYGRFSSLGTGTIHGTGEMDFTGCIVEASSTGKGISIHSDPHVFGWGEANIGGIILSKNQFYYGAQGVEVFIGAKGFLAGLWVQEGNQFEGYAGHVGKAVLVNVTGASSQAYQIHVSHCYMSGSGYYTHVEMNAASSGTLENFHVTDNDMHNAEAEFIRMSGTGGTLNHGSVSRNLLHAADNNVATTATYFENVTACSVDNNVWNAGLQRNYMINASGGTVYTNDNKATGRAIISVTTGVTTNNDNTN